MHPTPGSLRGQPEPAHLEPEHQHPERPRALELRDRRACGVLAFAGYVPALPSPGVMPAIFAALSIDVVSHLPPRAASELGDPVRVGVSRSDPSIEHAARRHGPVQKKSRHHSPTRGPFPAAGAVCAADPSVGPS